MKLDIPSSKRQVLSAEVTAPLSKLETPSSVLDVPGSVREALQSKVKV